MTYIKLIKTGTPEQSIPNCSEANPGKQAAKQMSSQLQKFVAIAQREGSQFAWLQFLRGKSAKKNRTCLETRWRHNWSKNVQFLTQSAKVRFVLSAR